MKDDSLGTILGESDGVTAVYHQKPRNPFHWKNAAKPPKRYNSDGSLAYVWVLVCLYNAEASQIKPMTAKFEEKHGWVDDKNQPIEDAFWKVTHWNMVTPPPELGDESLFW